MQSIEVSAKSFDEAKKAAAGKLGVDVSQIEAAIIEETKGLFGKSTVRVRAQVLTPAPESAPAEKSAAKKEAAKGEPVSKGRGRQKAEPKAAVEAPVAAAEPVAAAAEPAAEGAKKPRGGRGKKGAEAAPAEPVAAPSAHEEEVEVAATQADADGLADLLRSLVASADLSVTVKPTGISGRYVNLELDGKDVAFLVGKHGEVLNALQYLVNIIGNRKLTNGVRATLDGNDYRKRREDTLTQLAMNIAEQVQNRGEEAVLDALPAFERRIVHKALSTLTGITTYSEGEEPNRRVVIAPAD